MPRWLTAFTAVLALVSTQPVLAATFRQGVVQNFADLATASCQNPEGITADAGGSLYAAGLSGNICVVDGAGDVTRVIPVAAGHALLVSSTWTDRSTSPTTTAISAALGSIA